MPRGVKKVSEAEAQMPQVELEYKAPARYKVTNAFLHQSSTWPGIGGIEKTVNKMKGVEMSICEHGLMLKLKGKYNLVPWPNIANILMEIEE